MLIYVFYIDDFYNIILYVSWHLFYLTVLIFINI